jgi:anaerobic magnesium-protoporphyrin IX monomethyl ester cyclase
MRISGQRRASDITDHAPFRVLLIDPGMSHPKFSRNPYVNRGLLSIATFLQHHGIDVDLIPLDQWRMDGIYEPDAIYARLRGIIEGGDYRVIGLSAIFYAELAYVAGLGKRLKSDFGTTKLVIGGYPPTFEPEKVLERNRSIDFAIMGEGELALLNLIDHLQGKVHESDLRSICYLAPDGQLVRSGLLPLGSLDEIPPIDYGLLPKEYLLHTASPNINIEFNRGCPFSCSFCSASLFWQNQVRGHGLEKIEAELRQLAALGYRGKISFEDETIDIRTSNFKDFLRHIDHINRQFSFHYVVTRYDHIDGESLDLLKLLGFTEILIGLETASEDLQRTIGKKLDLIAFLEAARMVKKSGLNLNIFIIVGLPGETEETHRATCAYLERLSAEGLISNVFVSYFQPYSCTRAFHDLPEYGGRVIVSENDYDAWLLRSRPLVEYSDLKADRIREMFDEMLEFNKKSGSRFFESVG